MAERIVRFANVVGRENVIAGTDCGFSTFAGFTVVDPQITWAKLKAMADGARLASRELWKETTRPGPARKSPARPVAEVANRRHVESTDSDARIPKFKREQAEREFWASDDSVDYIDWRKAKRVILPKLKPSSLTGRPPSDR